MPFGNALTKPVPCESTFHQGAKQAATRFLGLKCPNCGKTWDVLFCSHCYVRLEGQGLKCKCGTWSNGQAWVDFESMVSGPITVKV